MKQAGYLLALALALLAAMALKGVLLTPPSPPDQPSATGFRRQSRHRAAGAHPRRPASPPGRQRCRRRGARAADRRDARGRARTRASPTISPATSGAAARSAARGCATWSRRSGRPRASTCCSSRIMTARRPGRARRTTASASPRCSRSRPAPGPDAGAASHLPVQRGRGIGAARRPRLPRRDPLRAGSIPRSTSNCAASPGPRSCSRPAGRTAPPSPSTATRGGRSPTRSPPTSIA